MKKKQLSLFGQFSKFSITRERLVRIRGGAIHDLGEARKDVVIELLDA